MPDRAEPMVTEALLRAAPPSAMPVVRPSARGIVGWWLPVVAVLVAEAVARWQHVPPHLMPASSQVVATRWDLAQQGLARHVAASCLRVFAGFLLVATAGGLLGMAVGLSRRVERVLDPTFQGLRAIPSLAWVPLLLLWLGIDETPKITLIAIGAFFPVYFNLHAGIRDIDRKLIEVARAMGLSRFATVRKVLLPGSLPSLFTGLRTALGLSWMFLVAAELIAATSGVGYLLTDGRETGRADVVMASIVVLGVLGKLSDSLLKALERRALHWRDTLDADGGAVTGRCRCRSSVRKSRPRSSRAARCSGASDWNSCPVKSWPWSARAVAARARCCAFSPGSTPTIRGRCSRPAKRCGVRTRCGWGSCSRNRACCHGCAWPTTSRSG